RMFTCLHIFFFSSRRRHTRLQGDWSSDVCSSDLALEQLESAAMDVRARPLVVMVSGFALAAAALIAGRLLPQEMRLPAQTGTLEIGRASCRERVEISVGDVSIEINNIELYRLDDR